MKRLFVIILITFYSAQAFSQSDYDYRTDNVNTARSWIARSIKNARDDQPLTVHFSDRIVDYKVVDAMVQGNGQLYMDLIGTNGVRGSILLNFGSLEPGMTFSTKQKGGIKYTYDDGSVESIYSITVLLCFKVDDGGRCQDQFEDILKVAINN